MAAISGKSGLSDGVEFRCAKAVSIVTVNVEDGYYKPSSFHLVGSMLFSAYEEIIVYGEICYDK